ncbi:MAG TPA: glucuronate isomerase, partial [Bacteroidales bacterium]|nr:glucuronate isomerase [Bacteroidales bacterium]
MKPFLDENFLLNSEAAKELYHVHAARMPIIDYHCHLSPADIASDRKFNNISEIWLAGDHYKWRAMRANGVDEKYITGDASDEEKFMKWAETVPATIRNPLYHWTHMELRRYFGINDLLGPDNAKEIYDKANAYLQTNEFSVRNLLRMVNVEAVCTTDDPIDSLEHHKKIKDDGFEITVLPAWRPDKAMAAEDTDTYNSYLDTLEKVADHPVNTFMDLLEALLKRHDFFHEMGCRLSDHGLEA